MQGTGDQTGSAQCVIGIHTVLVAHPEPVDLAAVATYVGPHIARDLLIENATHHAIRSVAVLTFEILIGTSLVTQTQRRSLT